MTELPPLPKKPTSREIVAYFHPSHGEHTPSTCRTEATPEGHPYVSVTCSCGDTLSISQAAAKIHGVDYAQLSARLRERLFSGMLS